MVQYRKSVSKEIAKHSYFAVLFNENGQIRILNWHQNKTTDRKVRFHQSYVKARLGS